MVLFTFLDGQLMDRGAVCRGSAQVFAAPWVLDVVLEAMLGFWPWSSFKKYKTDTGEEKAFIGGRVRKENGT